jgi:hypothetical protein
MILKKISEEYKLYGEDDSCIATTQESPYKRLSKQNCDEIFGIVDVEKLVQDYMEQFKNPMLKNYRIGEAFNDGYKKAMELNKDKLFTEDQMWNMFYFGDSLKRKIKSGNIDNKPMGEIFDDYIKSLQQPKEIEVEIEMVKTPDGIFIENDVPYFSPKLDVDGCLILKNK